jgi:hypothetical protein
MREAKGRTRSWMRLLVSRPGGASGSRNLWIALPPSVARSHIRPFAGPRARPDFHHPAGRRIEEALAGKAPVGSRRSVERAALVAALAEEEPDQKERKTEADGKAKRDHDTGSMTAAVP